MVNRKQRECTEMFGYRIWTPELDRTDSSSYCQETDPLTFLRYQFVPTQTRSEILLLTTL